MYSCRKFLGLCLTGLFFAGLFSSSDFSMNNPKELNQNDKIKSIAPAVDSDKVRLLPKVKTNTLRTLPNVTTVETKSLPIHSKPNDNRDCTDCIYDFTNYGSECCDSAWDEFGIDCATLEANYSWDCSGCLCPGDGPSCEDQGLVTCWDGSCAADDASCPATCEDQWASCVASLEGTEYYEACSAEDCEGGAGGACDGAVVPGLTDACGEAANNIGNGSCPDPCGGSGGDCEAGTISDCDGSGECWAESWIGDGFCDGTAQQFGADLCCFDNDGGDCTEAECAAPSCGDGTCNGDEDETSCPEDCAPSAECADCVYDFTNYGSECCDTAAAEFGIDCATLEANYSWDCTGCNCPLDATCEDQGLVTCWDGSCAADDASCPATCEEQGQVTCPNGSCAPTLEECAACDPGFVEDCDGSGECWPESWIGDGFADCEDQQFGADLTCYDNDGGDCDGGTTTTTTGGSADCEDCVYDFTNYGSECCDTAATEFGIDCATLEANYSWDCTGCNCPLDGDPVCGDGACNGDEDYYTCPEDCNAPGECDAGFVPDCADDDCCPESWIGDGFEDCEDQAFGCDLTCYDNDGGDCAGGTTTTTTTGGTADCEDCVYDFTNYGSECCDTAWTEFGIDCATLEANYAWDCTGCACPGDGPTCEDQGLVTCWDGSCAASAGDCPDEPVIEPPTGVCAAGSLFSDGTGTYVDVPAVTVTWETAPAVCGDGACNGDEDYYTCPEDCNAPGECDPGFVPDCVDSDCCPESWIGDGFEDCEDQAFGCDLTCYDNDGGDCGGGTTTTTTTGGTEACEDCVYDFTNYGSECCDTAAAEFGIDCATLEANYSWDCTGCNCPLDGDPVCGDGVCNGDEDYYTCPDDCLPFGECPEGQVSDCDGSGECWPESWIGDGFADCEDQQFGADLTCYDNDGGDCAGATTTGGTTGGTEACADCVYDFTNYGSECCDTAWTDFGIDCATLEANYSWDCSGCNCPGDAGRAENTRQLPVKTKEGSAYSRTNASFIGDANGDMTRNDIYVISMSCDACLGGAPWSGSFNADPTFGEEGFTVYGFDALSAVNVSVESCTNAGACSEATEEVTVIAGDTSSSECASDGGCDQAAGDSNNDGTINVLDVVGIVNHILAGGNGLEGCDLEVADFNGDETVNVLDVVAIVNLILAGGGRTADATDATMNVTSNSLSISANGYIGGVQMTLSHGADFSINLTEDAYVAEYVTNGNSTTLIVINPEDELIFTSNGSFDVDEVLVTNSEEFINVVDVSLEFSLSNAYPNPFNPSTTIELNIAEASYASVKVFNLKGEMVGVLMDGMVDANTYTMTWDASNLSSGVYMIRAEAGGQIATQKVMLVK